MEIEYNLNESWFPLTGDGRINVVSIYIAGGDIADEHQLLTKILLSAMLWTKWCKESSFSSQHELLTTNWNNITRFCHSGNPPYEM